ncbi:MAG: hypothetical protein A3I00_10070 [Betaproteobacteria bacterium RIFCSPLOWO2_02_FULL_64_12]|nr:MAG: hypothetical protein A3I00_10070 [Betaproteobacteria bacterium RIFCSPLOWO2_02_FULL_64_12]
MLRSTALILALALAAPALAQTDAKLALEQAKQRWAQSPHGPMLERLLPPTFEAGELPEPASRGAELLLRYCVQCHNLPNPAMHHAAKWPGIVVRMVLRMRGRGNMGTLMKEMMAGVSSPSDGEARALTAYLRRHAQRPIDAKRYPELELPQGRSFKLACSQCHVLPDPRRHTAGEWRQVVARMQENMQWMNRVVGTRFEPDEPQLRVEEINAFLARYARRE